MKGPPWVSLPPQAFAALGEPGRVVDPPVEVTDMRDVPRVTSNHPWLKGSDPYEEGSRCTLAFGRPQPTVYPTTDSGLHVSIVHVWGDRFLAVYLTQEARAWVLDRADRGDGTVLADLDALRTEGLCTLA